MPDERKDPLIRKAASLYEYALQEQWNGMPVPCVQKLSDGTPCTILSCGEWNRGKGPDFLNAVIRIREREIKGDIELHCRATDWIRHKHADDPAYGHVILHAVGQNDATAATVPFLPCIPVLLLPKCKSSLPRSTSATFCAKFFSGLPENAVRTFAEDAGLARFREKSDEFLENMIRLGTEKAFFLRLMELLGQPGCRDAFRLLANRFLEYPDEIRHTRPDVILWGESGFLPDPAAAELTPDAQIRVKALWDEWWKLRRNGMEPPCYRRNTRPLGSPERKIAYAALLLARFQEDPFSHLARLWNEADGPERLKQEFRVQDEFWDFHCHFTGNAMKTKRNLAGEDRVSMLLTDLVLPGLHAWFRLHKNSLKLSRLKEHFLKLPANPDNGILKRMRERCFPERDKIFSTAASQQGLIRLYREFCEPLSFQCRKCPFQTSLVTDAPDSGKNT